MQAWCVDSSMTRFALLACLAASACASSARPTPRPGPETGPPQRYELVPIESHDCGDFCSFHAPLPTSRVSGNLELRGASALLSLQSSLSQPVVICPSQGPRDPFVSCVTDDDPRAKAGPVRTELQLRGSVVRVGSTMSLSFTKDGGHLELRCTEAGNRLACTKAPSSTTRPWLGLPDHVAFMQQLAPMQAPMTAAAAAS